MHVTAIILAAGKGLRVKSRISKPLIRINSRAVIDYSLFAFSRHVKVRDIVVVANPENLKKISEKTTRHKLSKVKRIVLGGRERQDSVLAGLGAIDKKTELVLIHDAARPFVTGRIISAVIARAKKCGAAIAAVPVKDTIKRVTRHKAQGTSKFIVEETLDRDKLWEIQTPQAFKKEIVLNAYKRFGKVRVTDDAMLVEKMGRRVGVVLGSYNNIKITTPEDLVIAQAISRKLNKGKLSV